MGWGTYLQVKEIYKLKMYGKIWKNGNAQKYTRIYYSNVPFCL